MEGHSTARERQARLRARRAERRARQEGELPDMNELTRELICDNPEYQEHPGWENLHSLGVSPGLTRHWDTQLREDVRRGDASMSDVIWSTFRRVHLAGLLGTGVFNNVVMGETENTARRVFSHYYYITHCTVQS